jgi:hypothetical protein
MVDGVGEMVRQDEGERSAKSEINFYRLHASVNAATERATATDRRSCRRKVQIIISRET